MQKIVITEKGLEKKQELSKDSPDDQQIPSVQFDDEFLNQQIKNKQDNQMRSTATAQRPLSSVKPYFLECREILQKSLKLSDGIKFNLDISNKSQYSGVFPPHNQFTTFSKRFPNDKPMRATSSQQEFRKKIIKCEDIQSIKNFFSPPGSSQSIVLKTQTQTNNIKKIESINNLENQGFTSPIQEENKEIKTILLQMGNSQQNVKKQLITQSQLYNPDNLPSSNSLSKNQLQSPFNQLKNTKFTVKEEIKSPSTFNDPKMINNKQMNANLGIFTPLNIKKFEHNKQQNSFQLNEKDEFFDNPNEKVTSTFYFNQKNIVSSNNFSPIKSSLVKFNSASNLSNQQHNILINESVLKNQLHKWQLKKQNYLKSDRDLQQKIQKKVNEIQEEKGNKPVHVATSFINDLKNAEAKVDELYEYTEKSKKRHQERLKLFHIRKYKSLMSDMKLHTAQLSDKHHQAAHLGHKIQQNKIDTSDESLSTSSQNKSRLF